MKILIFGGTGFIGTKLVERLSASGFNITCISHDNVMSNHIQELKNDSFDMCYILSWGGVSGVDRMSAKVQFNNIYLVIKILDIISQVKIKKIFFASSISEFEFIKSIGKENIMPSISLYGGTKLYAHLLIRHYCEVNKIKSIFGYISSVYGPGDVSDKFISSSLKKLIFTNECLEFSSGTQLYDFIYIDDLIDDLQFILNNNISGQFIIGSGKYKPLREFIEQMCECFDKNNDTYRKFNSNILGESVNLKEFGWLNIDFLSNIYKLRRTNFNIGVKITARYIRSFKK